MDTEALIVELAEEAKNQPAWFVADRMRHLAEQVIVRMNAECRQINCECGTVVADMLRHELWKARSSRKG